VRRREAKPLAVIGAQLTEGAAAQAQRLIQHRVEHRLEITRRGIDDLQYLGGRGLLFRGRIAFGPGLIALRRADGELPP
jgi:hypothetical protein